MGSPGHCAWPCRAIAAGSVTTEGWGQSELRHLVQSPLCSWCAVAMAIPQDAPSSHSLSRPAPHGLGCLSGVGHCNSPPHGHQAACAHAAGSPGARRLSCSAAPRLVRGSHTADTVPAEGTPSQHTRRSLYSSAADLAPLCASLLKGLSGRASALFIFSLSPAPRPQWLQQQSAQEKWVSIQMNEEPDLPTRLRRAVP